MLLHFMLYSKFKANKGASIKNINIPLGRARSTVMLSMTAFTTGAVAVRKIQEFTPTLIMEFITFWK